MPQSYTFPFTVVEVTHRREGELGDVIFVILEASDTAGTATVSLGPKQVKLVGFPGHDLEPMVLGQEVMLTVEVRQGSSGD